MTITFTNNTTEASFIVEGKVDSSYMGRQIKNAIACLKKENIEAKDCIVIVWENKKIYQADKITKGDLMNEYAK